MSVAGMGAVGAGLTALAVWQAAPGAGALDRLADQWPLVAVLVGGLYLLFRAYQGLVEKVIAALDANTRAFSENAAATRRLGDGIEAIHRRVDGLAQRVERLEEDESHHPHGRGTP